MLIPLTIVHVFYSICLRFKTFISFKDEGKMIMRVNEWLLIKFKLTFTFSFFLETGL